MKSRHGIKNLTIIFPALLLIGVFVIRNAAFSGWDFRNNLWGPAYLLTQNQSPYRVEQLFELGNAVWMPMVIGLFFPLGFLPLQQASNLWFVFNLIWLFLIVWICSDGRRPSIVLVGVSVLFLVFPPAVAHLWLGQITILITLILLMLGVWGDGMPVFFLAFLMALSLVKPQLSILVLPGFIVYRIKRYGFRKTIRLMIYLALWMLLLIVPLFLAYPSWIPDFIFALKQNPSWAHPSSLAFLVNTIPGMGKAIWILLAAAMAALNIWLWIAMPAHKAVYWSMALTVLITPYVWTWDFVMLLPLFISSLFQAKSKLSLGILVGGYFICWLWVTSLKAQDIVNESIFWWVPWVFLSFIILSKLVKPGSGSTLAQQT